MRDASESLIRQAFFCEKNVSDSNMNGQKEEGAEEMDVAEP